MSASSKKKLHKEEAAAKLTEKQQAERKEAKKLKTYSIIFGVVIAAMLVFAVFTAVSKTISNSGILERNTVAATVGDHEISSAEMNIYFIGAVNNFYNQYGQYAAMFGLDTTKPLDEQVISEETGETWADSFLASAKESLRSVYALSDLAESQGMTLSEEDKTEIESNISMMKVYASYYGYSSVERYLKAVYGNGCTEELYREYLERAALADACYAAYGESLSYDDADLREAEKDKFQEYSSFTYQSYTLYTSKFLTGGTTDENGNTTYSDEEKAASVKAAEDAAIALTGENITTVEELNEAIAALSINAEAETPVESTANVDKLYTSVPTNIRDWVTDSSREAGDKTYIAGTTTSTDENGEETSTVNSYTVVFYLSSTDNSFPLANVRHILIPYESGSTDGSYTEEELMAVEAKGTDLLEQWKTAGSTEDAFATLANENSTDTGSNTNGGLYENVYPGQTMPEFNEWCFAEGRKAGDSGVIHTDYGCHVMYYVGDSDTTYRDYMISNELKNTAIEEWYNGVLETVTVTDKTYKRIETDLVLGA